MGIMIIDAEGWYGDYATVYATASTKSQLPKKWQTPGKQYRIVNDGGFPRDVGTRIHRQFAGHYRTTRADVEHQ